MEQVVAGSIATGMDGPVLVPEMSDAAQGLRFGARFGGARFGDTRFGVARFGATGVLRRALLLGAEFFAAASSYRSIARAATIRARHTTRERFATPRRLLSASTSRV